MYEVLSNNGSSSTVQQPETNPYPKKSVRLYLCKYPSCPMTFTNPQALGGHHHFHTREKRTKAKKRMEYEERMKQLELETVPTLPTLHLTFPQFPVAASKTISLDLELASGNGNRDHAGLSMDHIMGLSADYTLPFIDKLDTELIQPVHEDSSEITRTCSDLIVVRALLDDDEGSDGEVSSRGLDLTLKL